MTAAELHPLCRTRERKSVVDVVAGRAEVRLIINIPSAQVPSASLAEGNIEFELTEPQAERVRRKRQKPAQVHKFQVGVPQPAVAICTRHAEVIVHPKRDIAAKVSRSKDTEQARLKIRAWDERSDHPGCQLIIEGISVPAEHLKEVVIAQTNRRQARDGPWPDGVRPQVLLCRSAE